MMEPEWHEAESEPRRALWASVLAQAIVDAKDDVPGARRYILHRNADFAMVCSLAGLDPAAVRDRLVRWLENWISSSPVPTVKALKPPRRNTARRDVISLTHNGVSLSIGAWADQLGLSPDLIRSRLRHGWPIERVLGEPVRQRRGGPYPGVGDDFRPLKSTGAPRPTRDTTEMEISE